MSELDPTWNNEELANLLTPEIPLVSNPVALASCATDAIASTAGEPIDDLFWCAGSWGNIYPYSGMMRSSSGADPTLTSFAATKSRASIHRRGLAYKPLGKPPCAEE